MREESESGHLCGYRKRRKRLKKETIYFLILYTLIIKVKASNNAIFKYL